MRKAGKFDGENKDKIEDVGEANKRELTLQAWTIVDNVLDEDWNNVELTLISGLQYRLFMIHTHPITESARSFPRYKSRYFRTKKAPSFSPDRSSRG